MNTINILDLEDRETALVLATDRMARIAQNPLTQDTAEELRRLSVKVAELAAA
mgnify:FL=1